jgi:hypothetical protein
MLEKKKGENLAKIHPVPVLYGERLDGRWKKTSSWTRASAHSSICKASGAYSP